MLKGKLTYTGVAVAALGSVGLHVTASELSTIQGAAFALLEAAGVLVAVYGRWRAGRG